MVKAAGFIEGMAEVMGLPVETVRVAYRAMRTEGLLTSGARGVNAPDMIALDAARMLIWGLVSDRPMDAVNAVLDFGSLPFVEAFERNPIYPQSSHDHFPKNTTLELALVWLLTNSVVSTDTFYDFEDTEVEIQSNDLIATLAIDGTGYKFEYPYVHLNDGDNLHQLRQDNARYFDLRARYYRKIKQMRTIGAGELQEIADLIASK